jgi:hypothetical protein
MLISLEYCNHLENWGLKDVLCVKTDDAGNG